MSHNIVPLKQIKMKLDNKSISIVIKITITSIKNLTNPALSTTIRVGSNAKRNHRIATQSRTRADFSGHFERNMKYQI